MDLLKKFFPVSFKYNDNGRDLAIGIIIYVVAAILAGVLIWLATALTGWIPAVGTIIGWLLGIVSTLVGLYALAGIVIEVLVFAKVLKD